jgi:putative transcription factor
VIYNHRITDSVVLKPEVLTMPACEMCGKEAGLVKAKIEGTELELCDQCARFGEVISRPTPIHTKNIPTPRQPVHIPKRREIVQMIVHDYAKRIREAREKAGLTQEQFSGRLNERESIMQKIEAGQFKPSIDLARKLEKHLGIELIEQYDEGGEVPLASVNKGKDNSFTLGDFVKDKRKKG